MTSNTSVEALKYQRLNAVRKETWVGGVSGLLYGTAAGVICYIPVKYFAKQYYTKNYLLATVLLGGSMGSYLLSLLHGRQAAQSYGGLTKIVQDPNAKKGYVSKKFDEVMHNDDAFYRRQEAIKKEIEKRSNPWI